MFVAWRDLRFAKGRFALMGTVITLITVLVGLLSGLTAGLGRENTSAITGLPADRLAFAAADGEKVSFAESRVGEAAWQRWGDVPGVKAAEPLGILGARAETADGRGSAVSAFGVRPGSGLSPAPVAAGETVLSGAAADELGVGPGDSLTVAGEPLRVAAVAGQASYSHTPVVWTDLGDWQRLSGGGRPADAERPPQATVIALDTEPGTPSSELAAADARLGTHTVTREDALQAIGSFAAENSSLQLMRGFLFAISALVIGAFFTVWTIQRSADIAVLKALGSSTGYLLRDALGQALVLLLLGTGTGTAIAVGAGALVGGRVPFLLEPATILLPALTMIALGAVGAGLAVRRVTSVDPLTALGSTR
ncbi:ABC transporter permease [Streptomyces sp. TP-A0874]|uniref:ABC transporter permease n=1 Tax=Streptomyces sp. TP-A0874 TaxID=549819 RepID=UPI0008530EB6|nr:ABC transporter permease [Streptomyces sp. TP-A0874]